MRKYLLPENGNFYKANLHCHTTCSDGRLSPEQIKKEYSEHGYSVVAYTDHDVLLPHNELTDCSFLALNGYEMEINGSNGKTCHICLVALEPDNLKQVCWHRSRYLFGHAPEHITEVSFYEDEPDYVREYTHECISDMMRRGRDHGFFVTYNHPAWSLEDYRDYSGYDGMHAMEICNFGCISEGYPDYNPRVYDDMLRAGKRIFCIATDDNHNVYPKDSPRYDSFGGFTVIKAEKLDYRMITSALEKGHFYASQGPEINELYYEDGKLYIKTSPAARIDFSFGTRRALPLIASKGESICEASCQIPPDSIYVRVTVTDARGKPANTNAYFTDTLES